MAGDGRGRSQTEADDTTAAAERARNPTRTLSQFASFRRCGQRFRGEQAEIAEHAARRSTDRLGGQCGQFVGAIRLEERAETDAVPLQAVETLPQRRLVADAANDEVRVG